MDEHFNQKTMSKLRPLYGSWDKTSISSFPVFLSLGEQHYSIEHGTLSDRNIRELMPGSKITQLIRNFQQLSMERCFMNNIHLIACIRYVSWLLHFKDNQLVSKDSYDSRNI